MDFDQAHTAFVQQHLDRRKGERRGRLERGHREAEKLFLRHVWWPLVGHFDDLHPEFEVLDWREKSFFCDFVWRPQHVKLVIEIKGFGPHVTNMDRQTYCNELNRETFLCAMAYQVVSFSYDDVAYRPELCITLLRMLFSRYLPAARSIGKLEHFAEREVIRLGCMSAGVLRPVDVERHLGVNHRTAVRTLQQLSKKGLFKPVVGTHAKYKVKYEMTPDATQLL